MKRLESLQLARNLSEAGQVDEAYRIAGNWLYEDPNDVTALVVLTFVLRKSRKLPEAYHVGKRVTELAPQDAAGWINFGQICNELFRAEEAERAYRRGLSVARDPHFRSMLYTNMSALYIDLGRFDEAHEAADRSLEAKPESAPARSNLGFCQLAKRQWLEGWRNYRSCLGTDARKKATYRTPNEPEWDGTHGKRVILYGEQGLGDEICFASMIPDAVERCSQVILDIDSRLANLFRRSFPRAHVYGTRNELGLNWAAEDQQFDASIAIAQIGEFFRTKDEDFPASSYLTACPDRTSMWRALFSQKRKPVIGLAWTGGIWQTGAKFRKLQLEQFLPIMQSLDAHFVSLQYKDASAEIAEFRKRHPDISVEQYGYATLTKDYDDTAALVAAIDCVVSVPTAVVHLAAALGTPCIAMKSAHPCWKFYGGLAMHPEVDLVPNSGWDKTIMEAARRLGARFVTKEAA